MTRMNGCVGIAGVLGLACPGANAGSATASLPVTASVQSSCAASADSLAFAAYAASAVPVTGSKTITVKCSAGVGYNVTLSGMPAGEGLATAGISRDLLTLTITY